MTNIITYPTTKVITIAEPFSYDYMEYASLRNEVVAQANVRNFEVGDIVIALAQISSDECISGYGYVIFDEQAKRAFLVDISLFKTSNYTN